MENEITLLDKVRTKLEQGHDRFEEHRPISIHKRNYCKLKWFPHNRIRVWVER